MTEDSTPEQKARDMLERMGVENAHGFSAGEVVELANLIAERDHLASVVEFIGTADLAGELFPVGPSDVEYAAGENTVMRYVGPWHFLAGRGDTFLAAVEDAMQKA